MSTESAAISALDHNAPDDLGRAAELALQVIASGKWDRYLVRLNRAVVSRMADPEWYAPTTIAPWGAAVPDMAEIIAREDKDW